MTDMNVYVEDTIDRKYDLLFDDFIVVNRRILHRIKALRDFGNVKSGDIGGYIEKEENLSHEGNCWIFDNACVFDNARVFENARVYGNSQVHDNARVCGKAHVYEYSDVAGDSQVFGHARVYGMAVVFGNSRIC